VAHLRALLSPEEQRRWLPALVRDAVALPVRLLDTPQARVWYVPDWRFRQPKAEVRLKFYVEDALRTPREAMLAALYEQALEEGLNEEGYPVKEAGLSYRVQDVKGGILLSLGGYSGRMVELLDFLLPRLRRIDVDEPTFASLKERQRRGLVNERLDQPYRQAQYFLGLLLEQPGYTRETLLEALETLTLDDVRAYAARVLRRTYVEGVVVGNLPRDEARAAIAGALERLGAGVLPPARRVQPEVRALPPAADWVFSDRLDVNNSVLHLLYQLGPREPTLEAALAVISRPLGESFYHQLRTQQQLGYIVWAGFSEMRRMLTLSFLVQSGQYPADLLRQRMEAFIPEFVRDFRAMPPEAFEQYRVAAIQSRLRRPQSLADEADTLFWAAFRNDERFDYTSEQLAALETLTREDVEAVLTRFVTGPEGRRVAIRLTGSGHSAGPPRGQPVALPQAVRARAG
jgi:insulysin